MGAGDAATKIADLHVYGEVTSFQANDVSDFGGINLKSIQKELKDIGGVDDVDKIRVRINSPGGEVNEGVAIYNYLRSLGKPIETIADGQVASIATVIFMAGDVRKVYNNTDFMIHNPWTFAAGNADELEKNIEQLRLIENQLLDIYVDRTGANREALQTLMAEETHLSAAQITELKFAEVIEHVKAYAKAIKNSTNSNPKNTDTMASKFKAAKKIFATAWEQLNRLGVVKAQAFKTTDGNEIDIDLGDATEPAEGMAVTIDGAPAAAGDYTLENGDTITVDENGNISAITKAEPAPEEQTTEQMQAKIADLEKKVNQLTEENAQMKAEAEEITNHLSTLSVDFTPSARAQSAFNKPVEPTTVVKRSAEEEKNAIKNRARKK